MNVDEFIRKVEGTEDHDIFTQRVFYHLDGKMFAQMCGLLKEQEAEWIYGEDETGADGWHCSECNFFEPWFYDFDNDIDFIKRYEHCPKCRRRMSSYTGEQESH